MRSALIVAVLFLVASANGMTFHKLKHSALQARATSTSAVTTYDGFVIKAVSGTLPGCDDIGATKCQQLKDAATLATTTINAMLTHLATHKSDTKFTTAFGTASGADVKACLDKMAQSTSELKLWNALSNKDGTVYQSGAPNAWAGFAVITGTTKLLVGASSYSWSSKEMAEALIHEASHAFCSTVDVHNGKIGYKDSGFFDTCKGATNADSYRVYAQLM